MLRRLGIATALALTAIPAASWAQSTNEAGGTGAPSTGAPATGGSGTAGTTAGSAGSTGSSSTGATESGMLPENADSTLPSVESPPAVPPSTNAIPAPRPVTDNLDTRTAPIVEVHGYLRNRYDLFFNNSLGWEGFNVNGTETVYTPGQYNRSGLPWYRNPDYSAQWCFQSTGTGNLTPRPGSCNNPLQTSANMRMRLEPELHPTEFIALHAQIDLFDNFVLGSTPQGYYTGTADNRVANAPITFLNNTQVAPVAGQNSYVNSIVVKRAWAEINNQNLGQIRFGRMPEHWGLGMMYNAGNGYESDYQTDVDRIMYAARLRPFGLFFAASWDFASSGPNSANIQNYDDQGQPYDLSTWDDVHQWTVALGRRLEDDQIRGAISRGDLVINGGLHFAYRQQYLSNENTLNCTPASEGYGVTQCGVDSQRRDANAFIPDLWLQLLGPGFRIEAEAVYIRGNATVFDQASNQTQYLTMNQFGAAFEAEGRLLNNRLMVEFKSGYASGDPDVEGLNYFGPLRAQNRGNQELSLFRFHPDYRIDLIFWRSIMKQVAGAYYFRPTLGYNFIDDPNGDLFFGKVDVIWSRASEFISTRGNHADLGVEIDATLQYQTNHFRFDGVNRGMAPGFYAMLQGGVFFPLGGLQPTDRERMLGNEFANFHSQTALALHAYLGVMF